MIIKLNLEINNKAISLKKILDHSIQREPLLAYILNNIEQALNTDNTITINMWLSLCNLIYKKVWFDKKVLKNIFNKIVSTHPKGWDTKSKKFSIFFIDPF